MDTSTKSEKHKNDDFSGFPKMEPKSLLVHNKAEYFYEAFGLFFS